MTDHAERPAPIGPVDAAQVPRFAGPATFARLPRLDQVSSYDVAVAGVPFDAGVTYRPGARFGPAAVREASRLLRPYHPGLDVEPFGTQQVADAGDIACNPFDIEQAIASIEAGADDLLDSGAKLLTIGGDHTIALPLLRSVVAPARTRGVAALRRASGHVGHLLRCAVHARNAVPSGVRRGTARHVCAEPRGHPRSALRSWRSRR